MKYDNIPYVQEFFDYMDVECGLAHSSQESAAMELRLFFFFLQLEYFPDGVNVLEITAEHIRGFLVFLKEVRNNCSSSRNHKLANINMYFAFLKVSGYLGRQKNPSRGLRFAKKKHLLPVYLSLEEAEKLIEAAPKDSIYPYRDLAIFRLFLQTGCRLQELTQLKSEEIDLKAMRVRYLGKGNMERLVPFTEKTASALKNHMERRPSLYEDIPELFLNNRGAPMGKRGVQKLFHRVCKKAEITRPGLSVHKLRHTCFTILLRQGVDIVIIQEMAGHRDINSTEIYLHVVNEDVRAAMNKHPLG